jgi:hypothetical protein
MGAVKGRLHSLRLNCTSRSRSVQWDAGLIPPLEAAPRCRSFAFDVKLRGKYQRLVRRWSSPITAAAG